MRSELPGLVIDNCAMAGRSSKTFREEGRLDDIAAHIRPGDLLVVSFGHNDANRAKAERYVPADAFGESLRPFWQRLGFYGDGPELEKNIRLQIPNLREWVME